MDNMFYGKNWRLSNKQGSLSDSSLASRYLLYDDFSDAHAAGAVNGTLPKVGGARVATDTNSKISTSGGLLVFATGAATNDGVWWASQARKAGCLFVATVTPADTNGVFNVGWDNGQSGAILDALQFAASGVIKVIANGGTGIVIGAYTATTYTVIAQQRATGIVWYVKGGAFSAVTKLWDTAAGSAAANPAINVGSGTTIATASKADVPQPPYQGQPLANDGFSGATTDGLGTQESGGAGLAWTGATWTVSGGAVSNAPTQGANIIVNGGFDTDTNWTKDAGWTIAGGVGVAAGTNGMITQTVPKSWSKLTYTINSISGGLHRPYMDGLPPLLGGAGWQNGAGVFSAIGLASSVGIRGSALSANADDVTLTPITLSTLFRSLVVSTPDILAEVAYTQNTAGTQGGLVLNLDSASSPANFIIVYENGAGSILVDECVAGVYTNKQTTAITYSAGAVLRVIRHGTELRVFYNGVAVGSALTMTANTNVLHGLFDTYGNSFDNFVVYARGTNGEYSALNGM